MASAQKSGYDILQAIKKIKQMLYEQSVIGQVQSSMMQVIDAKIEVERESGKHTCHVIVRLPQFEQGMNNAKLVDIAFTYIFEDDVLTRQDKSGNGSYTSGSV